MISLYDFQQSAADQMASRVVDYMADPVTVGRNAARRRVPFVQFLSSITASGKTVVLADAVAQIAALSAVKPVVLWLSKLTVVVEQSLANLEPGGTYNDLIDLFEVRTLSELSIERLKNQDAAFLFFATTGTFNVRGKEGRKVFDAQIDKTDKSIWDALNLRPDRNNIRRPLIVVYDEAHNLSIQQTDLLLGLEPDAFLLSTATSRVPQSFYDAVTKNLQNIGEFKASDLNVAVSAQAVAASGLVKRQVDLVGRQGPMEDVVTEMVTEMELVAEAGHSHGLPGVPKAVYVCRTNITEGDDRRKDDPARPFVQRQAPPILIWRHLVEGLGVDPASIAVYCDLKVDKSHPLPSEFVLYRGGEKDYAQFAAGSYTHIIFNQSLEEGWDDPLVYFAYIDKTLGSTIAAEQIVGRLLRQPGRQHYTADRLNTAQLYIRVETNKVFDDVVSQTRRRLEGDDVPVLVTSTSPGISNRKSVPARVQMAVPDVATHTEDALEAMAEAVAAVPDFRNAAEASTGVGRRARVQRVVGEHDEVKFAWEEIGTSARVAARWLFSRSLRRFHRDAAAIITLHDPKWDALIGVGSPAATNLEVMAQQAGEAFIEHSYIEVADLDDEDFIVGPALARDDDFRTFTNSVHEGYSGLNKSLEVPFVDELDKTGHTWARNPSRTGFGLPLIKRGGNDVFYPDFIVWAHGDVYVVDTKGSHIQADALRKLVRIRQSPGRPRVHVRFVVEGRLDSTGGAIGKDGYTVVGFKPDGDYSFVPCADMAQAVLTVTKVSK